MSTSARPARRLPWPLAISLLLAVLLVMSSASPADSSALSSGHSDDSYVLLDESGVAVAEDRAEYFVRVREAYGLRASVPLIQEIINDHGIAPEWGFPLSPVDIKTLEDRLAIQEELGDDIILGFESLPGYAGFYFDLHNDGAPTILTTEPEATKAAVTKTVSAALAGKIVITGAGHTWNDLVMAADTVAGASDSTVSNQVHRVAIDVKNNRLGLTIADSTKSDSVSASVSDLVSVPFEISVEPVPAGDACSSRTMCYSPFRAGIETSGATLGFGVIRYGDRQYVVAGHHIETTYTHYIFNIGSTTKSGYYSWGIDARAISATDSQVSDDIYKTSSSVYDVIGTKYPSVGLSVCISGRLTSSCGPVEDNYLIYNLTNGMSNLRGASSHYWSQGGDSGAPVFQKVGSTQARAVGIHSAGAGYREFARAVDFYQYLNVTIATS